MKKVKAQESTYFVDESGDPTFYDDKGRLIVGQQGCSPVLILGFIETQNPHILRKAVLDLPARVTSDPYLAKIPSLNKTAVAFHAKDDAPEVRYEFFKLIQQLEFKAQFVVCRKREDTFRSRHKGKTSRFYDDLVTNLFQSFLHRFEQNRIYMATRGSSVRRQSSERYGVQEGGLRNGIASI